MFKLIFLTLLAFITVLVVFGEGDSRRVEAEPVPTAETAPEAASTPEPEPEAPIIPASAVEQTPEQVQQFAGPELRPSPEYAGQEPETNLADAPTDTLYVTGNSVNFRAGPSTSEDVVGRLSRGQMVTAIGPKTGDWVQLRDGQGRTGFMSARFLSAERP
ncbi:SH3 domain-containing protein [Paracoccus sp. SCSIO 75233]|uniref:SH3 domain-containing protein n=1 Tax=Paracoccus sp. SCSIO 75233 TaxID=3017782 RepID=UPI0022F0E68E|nr:SH3 domain-containing protein [Paracoccus sp. SCSIO 75233]WBU53720.1 SH3 domain-containing protein [Paracoccus sp. SCSIO 75233]